MCFKDDLTIPGEVYLAEDTKLDRKVALKILPPDLAENDGRRDRFQREAKALAALNHPNIITIHSVEDFDSIHFITAVDHFFVVPRGS